MSIERSLRALMVQAEFELAEAAFSLASSVDQRTAELHAYERVGAELELVHGEMRRSLGEGRFNPVAYRWTRHTWLAQRANLEQSALRLDKAEQIVQEQSDNLAHKRLQESRLARALDEERRRLRRMNSVREQHGADESWLHADWSNR